MLWYWQNMVDCGYVTRGSYKTLSSAATLLLFFFLALDPYL